MKRTGRGLLAFVGGGFAQIFRQIVSMRVKILSNKNVVALRQIKGDVTRDDSQRRFYIDWCITFQPQTYKCSKKRCYACEELLVATVVPFLHLYSETNFCFCFLGICQPE